MGLGIEHGEAEMHPEEEPPIPTPPLSQILQVRAIAIPPPPWDMGRHLMQTDTGTIHTRSAESSGSVDDNGSFEVLVPEYPYGYYVALSGDKIQLNFRLRGRVQVGSPPGPITIDIASTLAPLVSHKMGATGRRMTNAQIAQQLGPLLPAKVGELAQALQQPGFPRARWRQAARELMAGQQGGSAGLVSRVNATFETTGCSPGGAGVVGTGCANHNLMDSSEMPAVSTSITFGSGFPLIAGSRNLADQYSSSGVRFSGYPAFSVLPTGAFSFTQLKEVRTLGCLIGIFPCRYYVKVDPSLLGGGVTLDFSNDSFAKIGVKSIGMSTQNGDTHNDSTGRFARRGFRLVALDAAGDEIHQYLWYTHQETAGGAFYGITSDTPI